MGTARIKFRIEIMGIVTEESIKYKYNYRRNNFCNFDRDQFMPAGEKEDTQRTPSNLSSSPSLNI